MNNKESTLKEILEFRNEIYGYARSSGSEEARKLAELVSFSLIGAAHEYPACCILNFCKSVFHGEKSTTGNASEDGRVMCPECESDGG